MTVDGSRHGYVAVLRANASGNVTPICTITYSGLYLYVGGLALDSANTLWVTHPGDAEIFAFPYEANGDFAPTQHIAGSYTELIQLQFDDVQHATVEPRTGNLWVPVWYDYNRAYGYLVAFTNDANGNVTPVAEIGFGDKGQNEHIAAPVALAFDHHGNLYVGESYIPGVVEVFSPPFQEGSQPVATWTLKNKDEAYWISVDGSDNVYVGGEASINVFAGGLKSGGVVAKRIGTFGADIEGMTVDERGHMYVSRLDKGQIFVFNKNWTTWGDYVRVINYGPAWALLAG
jgi:hypothetical protein